MWLILWCLFGSVCLLSGYEAFSFGMMTRAFPLALGSRKIEGRSAMACCVTLRPPAMQGAVEILKPDAVSSDMRSARSRAPPRAKRLFAVFITPPTSSTEFVASSCQRVVVVLYRVYRIRVPRFLQRHQAAWV